MVQQNLANEININEGSENECLVIKPKKQRKRYSLEQLVNGITPENKHNLIIFGDSMGKEVW